MEQDLNRFKIAQKENYPRALEELKSGKKRTHWMWYIFPQLRGLGYSSNATYYGIDGIEEAMAYLEDEELYANLVTLCKVLLDSDQTSATKIFGPIDAGKLKSSMTLFSYASELIETRNIEEEADGGMPRLFAKSTKYKEDDQVFDQVLDKFYEGEKDHVTEDMLFKATQVREIPIFDDSSTKQM